MDEEELEPPPEPPSASDSVLPWRAAEAGLVKVRPATLRIEINIAKMTRDFLRKFFILL